jgi:GH25 family lysozyme M1 (1,4-beta-N-acetylmuramidase)
MAIGWEAQWAVVHEQFPDAYLTDSLRPGANDYHGLGLAVDVAYRYPEQAAEMLALNRWLAERYPDSTELIHTPGVNLRKGQPYVYSEATQAAHWNHVHWAMDHEFEGVSEMAGIFGVDVSAYQPNFDFQAAKSEGYDFAIIKATEGAGWRSSFYRDQAQRSRSAGLVTAAYHYQGTQSVASQVSNIQAVVDTDTPIAIDVELNSGGVDITRGLVSSLESLGYKVFAIYLPKWYWQGHLGSPSLDGLPDNWVSWYPDNVARFGSEGFSLVPESVWVQAFGGLPTRVVQFTSSGKVANYPSGNIDLNYFRGTRAEFEAWLGGSNEEEIDVATLDEISAKLDRLLDKVTVNHVPTDDNRPLPIGTPDDLLGFVMSTRAGVQLLLDRTPAVGGAPVEFDYTRLAEALKSAGAAGVTRAQLIADVTAIMSKLEFDLPKTSITVKQSL